MLSASGLKVDPDGGYNGLVIKIGDEVPEEACPQILENLKVRNNSTDVSSIMWALP